MPSETDVLNDSLGMIGANRITAIDDGSVNANHCQTFYPTLRDSALRSHHWNFSMKRVELAQDAATPTFEFQFQYTLPADCLKVVEYNGASQDTSQLTLLETVVPNRYRIEGRKLLTNDGQVKIVYIRREEDPNVWDGLFEQVITTWLASKLANAIAKDAKKSTELLKQVIDVLLPTAMAVDGQEGSTEKLITTDLIDGR